MSAPSSAMRIYRAPDGTTFTQAERYREYMIKTYYSFRKRKDCKLIKVPGDLCGQPMELAELHGCTILILDITSHVTISGLRDCRVFITPCAGAVMINDSSDCVFSIAAAQLRMSRCERCIVNAHVQLGPALEMSKDITIGPFNGNHSLIKQHFKAAGLDEGSNSVFDVTDFSATAVDELGPIPHWRKLDVSAWDMVNVKHARSQDGEDYEEMQVLPPIACLAAASLLDRFDADGDAAWDFLELNGYQAATGDEDRVADNVEMQRMFQAADIQLDSSGKLRLPALLQLYTMQGSDALQRDIIAVGARDLVPGKLPMWVVKLPPGAAASLTGLTSPKPVPQPVPESPAFGVSARAPSQVTVTVNNRQAAGPPVIPRLSTPRSTSMGNFTPRLDDSPVKALCMDGTSREPTSQPTLRTASKATQRPRSNSRTVRSQHPVDTTLLNKLLQSAAGEKGMSLLSWYRQSTKASADAASSVYIHKKDFMRSTVALYLMLSRTVDLHLPEEMDTDEEEAYVKFNLQKAVDTFADMGWLSPYDSEFVNYKKVCDSIVVARPPRSSERRAVVAPPKPPVDAAAPPDASTPRTATVAGATPSATSVATGAMAAMKAMLQGEGPFLAGCAVKRSPRVSATSTAANVIAKLQNKTSDALITTFAGETRSVAARSRSLQRPTARQQAQARASERLRLINKGDADGLAKMLLEDLELLARSERMVRFIRSVKETPGYTIEGDAATAAPTPAPASYLLVADVISLLETAEVRYPLPVVALALLQLGGKLLVPPELAALPQQEPPAPDTPEAEVWAQKVTQLCDYSKAVIQKDALVSWLTTLRNEHIASRSVPLQSWTANKLAEEKAAAARALVLFRTALASAVKGIPRKGNVSWLTKAGVHALVAQYEILPELWLRKEVQAAATAAVVSGRWTADEAETEAKVRAKADELYVQYTSSPDFSEKLFWSYVEDTRKGRWPAAFDSAEAGDLPATKGCELYPEGFEKWLQWREYRRIVCFSEVRRWQTEKLKEKVIEEAEKHHVTTIAQVERLVDDLASKAQTIQEEGNAVGVPHNKWDGHGAVRASHPSRAGLDIKARLARLKQVAKPPPEEFKRFVATATVAVHSEDGVVSETEDDRGSHAGQSVAGSVVSATRLATVIPEPAGRVVSQHDFLREFKDVLFSLRADKVVSAKARALSDPRGTARQYVLFRLQQDSEDGALMRQRLEEWRRECGQRALLLQQAAGPAEEMIYDVDEEALNNLIEEEARTALDAGAFNETEDQAMMHAVAEEITRQQKAQRTFAEWIARKEAERRDRAARAQAAKHASEEMQRARRARSAQAYREWLRTSKTRSKQEAKPYAHEGWIDNTTTVDSPDGKRSMISPSRSSIVDGSMRSPSMNAPVLAVRSPASAVTSSSSIREDTTRNVAAALNFTQYSLGDDARSTPSRTSDALNKVQTFHAAIITSPTSVASSTKPNTSATKQQRRHTSSLPPRPVNRQSSGSRR